MHLGSTGADRPVCGPHDRAERPRVLIDAVAAAGRLLGRPIKLVMAGEGQTASGLIAAARVRAVRASFPGWVTGRNAPRCCERHRWSRSRVNGRSRLGSWDSEAALHGVPAVAFDVGGISEWLHDGVNGRLVRERGSADAMSRALVSVLGDPTVIRTLEQGAVQTAARLNLEAHLQTVETTLAAMMKTMHLLAGEWLGGRRSRRLWRGPRGGVVAARTPRARLGRA